MLGSPGAALAPRCILDTAPAVPPCQSGHFHPLAATQMAPKLDSQGWIDSTTASRRPFAFFVRNDIIWVRCDGKYKCSQIRSNASIPAARVLAALIATESDHWMDEPRAKRAGLPSE